jgi:hypothetical protein
VASQDVKGVVESHEQSRRELARHDAALEEEATLIQHINECTKIILAQFAAAHEYSVRIEEKLAELDKRVAELELKITPTHLPH